MEISHQNKKIILIAGAAFVLGMVVLYLTPLKYAQFIEPKIKDVDARTMYAEIQEHPELFDFIDVRGQADYENLHAAGSRSIPLYKMYFERHNLPKSGKKIVLICSGGVASGVAYMYLEHFGFRNMVRIDGGIENWVAYDLPTQSGDK